MTAVRMDSLRQKTLALFLVALAVLLTIQGAYVPSVLYTNHQSAEDYADFSAQQVCSTTRQVFQNYDNALCQLGQNRDVQDLFMETDPYQYYLSYNAVQTVCRSMSQVQEGIENILLLDLDSWNGSVVLEDGLFLACDARTLAKIRKENGEEYGTAVAGATVRKLARKKSRGTTES